MADIFKQLFMLNPCMRRKSRFEYERFDFNFNFIIFTFWYCFGSLNKIEVFIYGYTANY